MAAKSDFRFAHRFARQDDSPEFVRLTTMGGFCAVRESLLRFVYLASAAQVLSVPFVKFSCFQLAFVAVEIALRGGLIAAQQCQLKIEKVRAAEIELL